MAQSSETSLQLSQSSSDASLLAQAPAAQPQGAVIVLRINVPTLKLQKALKVNTADTVWHLKRQLIEKFGSEAKDAWNFGIFLRGHDGKQGKFLDERKELTVYNVDSTSQVDFVLKFRLGAENDSKKQKKIIEDYQKGNLDKIRERISRTTETNFWSDSQETEADLHHDGKLIETLLYLAVMNNDREMIQFLVENGAFLDFRNGDKDGWKTPLHLAAVHNKPLALKTLLEYGAWPNSVDIFNLTPIFYAATSGHSECVLRLLMAKADTEIFDESGKGPLHQASLNNFDCIVALLIDFGANMHAINIAGNTPLHVAATRNSKESTKWLLLRGAPRDKKNKSGKTPYEVAIQANCPEVSELIQKFTDDQIVPPPPKSNTIDGDPNAIVSNVLSSLSGSIGGEYKPQPFSGRNSALPNGPGTRTSYQQATSPNQDKATSPSSAQSAMTLGSHISMVQSLSPTTIAPPVVPRKANVPGNPDFDAAEQRKSMRKSVNMPPQPPKRMSTLGANATSGNTTQQLSNPSNVHSSISGINRSDSASNLRLFSHTTDLPTISGSDMSREGSVTARTPNMTGTSRDTATGASETRYSSNRIANTMQSGDSFVYGSASQSGVDLTSSMSSLIAQRRENMNESINLNSSMDAVSMTEAERARRSRPILLSDQGNATSNDAVVAHQYRQSMQSGRGAVGIRENRHALTTATQSVKIALPETYNTPQVLDALRKLMGPSVVVDATGHVDPAVITKGVDELDSFLAQTLKSLRQLEAENQRLRSELNQTRA